MLTELRHRGAVLHREGRIPVAVATLILVALDVFIRRRGNPQSFVGLRRSTAFEFASIGFVALLAQFFRYPGCSTPIDEDLIVAPSYGRIVHIGPELEPEILGDRRIRISIFLSLFDPHLTRSPITGKVVYQKYHPGRYLVALNPKASTLNERHSLLIEHENNTRILVRQIAGFVARRICTYVQTGSSLKAGEEVGFIKFGSRVDLFVPEDSAVLVKDKQYVHAGRTSIARMRPSTG